MTMLEFWELLSYVVTVVGLPLAILIFIYEQRRERANEDDEVFQLLSDNYQDFLKIVLSHPDLNLFTPGGRAPATDEARERLYVVFSILISLFERAYLLLYDEHLSKRQQRHWRSWEDYMREWCRREEFRALLPALLPGEDPDFSDYIRRLSAEEAELQPVYGVRAREAHATGESKQLGES